MNKIVEELKKVKVFYVATIEGDKPKVRPFSSVTEFEGHAYICTGNKKDFYKQIKNNPHVELCGMYDETSWLRIEATLKEDNRIEVQQAILDDHTGPKGLYKPGDGIFATFQLTDIKAIKYSFFSVPIEIKE